ncbi:MAG: hypothetical protein OEW97_01765, partial [Gammaproteobacteria bacterium]|nr:hypothetical protein [Gammaproteobacteria bacterium]
MYQNKMNREKVISNIKLSSLITALLLVSACGGGEDSSEANAIGIQDVAIAYVKRPTPRDNMNNVQSNDLRIPAMFNEGGDLYLQERATASAKTINVTRRLTNGLGDVKDVSSSYDGTKLVFSLRLPDPDPNDTDIPRWYLYQYDITSDTITQLTSSAVNDGDDISPHFLPDGRIIFSSTRQKTNKTIRENESRGTFTSVDENRSNSAFKLHVRNLDGSIQQVSFNQSHDLNPIVLKDSGRILFSRWNHMGSRNDVSLYSMNPDGTDVQLYYGAHSHNTGQNPNTAVQFYKPQEIEDGRIMAILRPFVT